MHRTNPTTGNLDHIADPVGRGAPKCTHGLMLKLALLGSPRGKLSLNELYQCLMERFPYYKDLTDRNDLRWQVRVALSIARCW